MTHIWVRPTEELLLAPVSRLDQELISRLPVFKKLWCDIRKPRSGKHHRKFFAILDWAFQHQNRTNNFEWFRAYITCKAGHCNTCELPPEQVNGPLLQFMLDTQAHVFFEPTNTQLVRVLVPRSIAYDKMDQDEFNTFYPRALDVIQHDFGIDVSHFEEGGP